MKRGSRSLLFSLILFVPAVTRAARPLFLEPAATVGRFAFETTLSLSGRMDKFGSPESEYQSESFPVSFRLGLNRRFDIGFTLQHVSQRISSDAYRFSGSDSGRFSPEFKWALRDNISLQGIYHFSSSEEDRQGFPIARGDSPEVRLLAAIPIAWPICFDVGYLRQGRYNGREGINSVPQKNIDPGDIADARAAILIPLPANFATSLETIFSHIDTKSVDGVSIEGTKGDALDIFTSLSWSYKNLTLGVGVGAGLLNESHTSFAIDRGAGDYTAKFLFSYKLQPPKVRT